MTNQVAEYQAAIRGLRVARQCGARRIALEGDSLLVINQLSGYWQVRDPAIQILYDEARGLFQHFDEIQLRHIRRAGNTAADLVANLAADGAHEHLSLRPLPPPVPISPQATTLVAAPGCPDLATALLGVRPGEHRAWLTREAWFQRFRLCILARLYQHRQDACFRHHYVLGPQLRRQMAGDFRMVARRAWVLAAHERPGVAVTTNLRLLRPGIVAGVGGWARAFRLLGI